MNALSFSITRNTDLQNVYQEMDALKNYLDYFYKDEVNKIWKKDQRKLNFLVLFNFLSLIIISACLVLIPFKSINMIITIIIIAGLGIYSELNRRKTAKAFDDLLTNIYKNDDIVVNDLAYYQLCSLVEKGDQQTVAYKLVDRITKDDIKMEKIYRKYHLVSRNFDTFENLINFLKNKKRR